MPRHEKLAMIVVIEVYILPQPTYKLIAICVLRSKKELFPATKTAATTINAELFTLQKKKIDKSGRWMRSVGVKTARRFVKYTSIVNNLPPRELCILRRVNFLSRN